MSKGAVLSGEDRLSGVEPGEASSAGTPLAPTLEPLRRPENLSPRARVHRAVYLLALTVLLPGTAQLVAGSRAVARVALRVWLGLLGLVVAVALLWLVSRSTVFSLVTSPFVLGVVTVVCFAVALGWPLLVLDAWRLGRPGLLPRQGRLLMTGLLVLGLVVTSVPLVAAGRRTWAAADLISGVFGSGRASDAAQGRYNVLLMGGDAGPDRIGTRPDSMTLASIDARTGRTVLFSLPRNLEDIPFPASSPAHAALPDGWSCGDNCLLNGLYTWGSEHKSLYPGVADPGAQVMKEAAEGITGLKVNYYVLIDLRGFRQLIDAMGGITVTVNQRVPIGGGTSKVSGYIPVGTQRLDGYHALWFARSRHGASDYARMERQRCVMNAMVQQLDPATLLAKFQDIAAASKNVVSTDLPAGALGGFIDLGTKAKSQKITSVQFVPPLINPARPDFTVVRAKVDAAITAAEKPPAPAPTKKSSGTATTPATGSSSGSSAGSSASAGAASTAPGEVDISTACSAG